MSGLLPFYLMRQWTNDGKLASGGSLTFSQSGTNTPKAVYQDAALTIPHTNPVTLDASGSAVIFLGSGAYRVTLKDAAGAQVAPPVDGVIGGGSAADSTASMIVVATYADVRAMTATPDAVVVCGRSAIGDGGQGIFQRIPAGGMADNDGTVLTNPGGTVVYRREEGGIIDPRWFGVRYGVSSDQYTWLATALDASAAHNLPLVLAGSVYVNQNVTVPVGASIHSTLDGFFTSTLAVGIGFQAGTSFRGEGPTFGQGVGAVFELGTVEEVPLSWFADGSGDTKATKWIASSSASGIPLALDIDLSVGSSIAASQPFRQVGISKVTFSAVPSVTISLPQIMHGWQAQQIFSVNASTTSFSFDFGANLAFPEWFGGVGDNTTVSTRAVQLAAWSGKLGLGSGKTYRMATPTSLPASLLIDGAGVLHLTGASTFSTTTLTLQDCGIVLDNVHNWFTGTQLNGQNATFPSTYTATSVNLDGCYYTDDTRNPVYAGKPALYNGHFPLIPSASILGTDSVGKVISKASTPLVYGGAVWDLVAQPYSSDALVNRIKYINSKWYAFYKAGRYAYSADGFNWTTRSINDPGVTLQDMAFDGTHYVMVGYRSDNAWEQYAWRGTDGLNWNRVTLPVVFTIPGYVRNVAVFGGKFYAQIPMWRYIVSSDYGATWTAAQYYNPPAGSYPGENAAGFVGEIDGQLWLCDGYGNSFYSSAPNGLGSFTAARTPAYDIAYNIVSACKIGSSYHLVDSAGDAFNFSALPYSSRTIERNDFSLLLPVDNYAISDVCVNGPLRMMAGKKSNGDRFLATDLNHFPSDPSAIPAAWTTRTNFVLNDVSCVGASPENVFLAGTTNGNIYRTI